MLLDSQKIAIIARVLTLLFLIEWLRFPQKCVKLNSFQKSSFSFITVDPTEPISQDTLVSLLLLEIT